MNKENAPEATHRPEGACVEGIAATLPTAVDRQTAALSSHQAHICFLPAITAHQVTLSIRDHVMSASRFSPLHRSLSFGIQPVLGPLIMPPIFSKISRTSTNQITYVRLYSF